MSDKLMTQADNVTLPGGGLYALATKGAKDVIDNATPQILSAVNNLHLNTDSTQFTMTDMGCADSGTSLGNVRSISVMDDPHQHGMGYVHAYMTISKI